VRQRAVVLLALSVAAALAGCGGKDTAEPPAELQPIETSLNIDKVWSARVGHGSERLRLGLRPATDGARLYAGARDGTVAAFDAETGDGLWSVDTGLPLAAGPAFGGGRLAVGTSDGDLLVLDADDGEELWREPVGSEILAPPALNADVVVLRTVDGRLHGLSASDGTTLWVVEQQLPALTLRGNTAPYIAGNSVVAGFDNGRLGAYDLQSGEAQWEIAIGSPTGRNELERLDDVSAGLQVVGNDVYAAAYHGRAAAVDLRTGIVIWQQELSSFAGLGVDANNVYVTNDVGYIVALDRQSGAQVWRQEALRLRDVTAPTRYLNAIVVGDFEGYLHWLSVEDGHFLGRVHAASDRITGAPLVIGPRLFVQSDGGTVAAYAVVADEETD
jgi:outer membrane protein assembly factor BamB